MRPSPSRPDRVVETGSVIPAGEAVGSARLWLRDDRGAAALEFAVLLPVLILLFGVVVGGARLWLARGVVDQAAAAAARGVSQSRTPGEAARVAQDLITAQLAVGDLRCDQQSVEVDTSVLTSAPGTPGQARVTFSCEVPLGDVLVPGWPGTVEVRSTWTSVVDRYRGRQ